MRAQTEGTRRRHLNLFLGASEKEIDKLKLAVQKARSDVNEALRNQELAQKEVAEKKKVVDKHREIVKNWEWRQHQHTENEDQLAQAMRIAEEAAQELEERNQAVARAQACADAAARLQITRAAYKKIHQSSQVIPLAMERWHAVKDAVKGAVKARREFAGLEETPIDLGVALENAESASERLRILDMDPTAPARHQLAERRGKLKQQIDDNQTAIRTLDTELGDARCPTCNNPLDEHQRTERVAHLQSWLEVELPLLQALLSEEDETLTQEQLAWKTARQQAEIDARQADKNVETAKQYLRDLQQSREQLAQAEKKLCEKRELWRNCGNYVLWDHEQELINTCQKMERRIAALEQRASGYAELSRLRSEQEHAEQKYFSMKATVKDLEIKRSDIAYDVELHQQAERDLQLAQNEQEFSEGKLRAVDWQVGAAENAAKKAEELTTSAGPLFEEVEKLAFSYLQEEQLFKLLKDFSDRYFGQNIRAIEERANTLILQAVRDGSIQGIRLGDRQLQYLDGSYIPQDTSRLSGGEKALVGLCLRIAVAEQALAIAQKARPRFLILDEVLSALDEERLEQMQQVFSEVTQRGLFEHIIMITHLESIKQNWQGTRLSVIKDNKASSSTATFIKNNDMSLSEVIDTP